MPEVVTFPFSTSLLPLAPLPLAPRFKLKRLPLSASPPLPTVIDDCRAVLLPNSANLLAGLPLASRVMPVRLRLPKAICEPLLPMNRVLPAPPVKLPAPVTVQTDPAPSGTSPR